MVGVLGVGAEPPKASAASMVGVLGVGAELPKASDRSTLLARLPATEKVSWGSARMTFCILAESTWV